MPADPIPTNERMVYLVPSDAKAGRRYRVDLLANNGAGWCQCTDFGTRRQPAIDKGSPPWTSATVCKHLKRTAWYFAKTLFRDMAAAETRR